MHHFSRFDRLVWSVIALLLSLFAVTFWAAARPRFTLPNDEPLIAWLAPADSRSRDLYVRGVNSGTTIQVLDSVAGIRDYAIDPAGRWIAFVENGGHRVEALDLTTGERLTWIGCGADRCDRPRWRPGYAMISYERISADDAGVGRVWLLDVNDPYAPNSRPAVPDIAVTGVLSQWSSNGERLAFYNGARGETVVYDMALRRASRVTNEGGREGVFSPNGSNLYYPEQTALDDATVWMRAAAIGGKTQALNSPPGVRDSLIAWLPDGSAAVVARRTDLASPGAPNLILMDARGNTVRRLTDATAYSDLAFAIHPSGTSLLIERAPFEIGRNGQPDYGALPELWHYDMNTGALTWLIENATMGSWVGAR